MVDWLEYCAAIAVFLALHSIPTRPAVKSRIVGRIGRTWFTLAYSVVSLLTLAWLIGAAGRAPLVTLWPVATWQTWVPLIVMVPVFAVAALAAGQPNPFSFGGGRGAFDPARPGVVWLHRHPLLLALALWSAAHLVPNGDLAHVILFGLFAGFAVLGMRMIDRRKQREMGAAWARDLGVVRGQPLSEALRPGAQAIARMGIGILLYVGMLHLHPVLFGVGP